MATRSIIAVKTNDNNYTTIYAHWDGAPDTRYPILVEGYNTQEKVEELISMGDASVINETIEECKFYGRDNKEDDTDATTGIKYLKDIECQEFLYVWDTNEWKVYNTRSGYLRKLKM